MSSPHFTSEVNGTTWDLQLVMRQQPTRCRVLSAGEFVDRRPIEPIPVVQLVIKDPKGRVSRNALQQTNYFMMVNLVGDDPVGGDGSGNSACSAAVNSAAAAAAAATSGIPEGMVIRGDNSRSSVFSGGRVSSLHCLRDLDGSDVGLFVFPNLSVRRQGSFRLRFELYSLVDGSQVRLLSSLDSAVFRSYPIHSFPGSDGSSPLCKLLIDQGVKIPFRKRFRASNPPRHLTLKKFGEEAPSAITAAGIAAARSRGVKKAAKPPRRTSRHSDDEDEDDSDEGDDDSDDNAEEGGEEKREEGRTEEGTTPSSKRPKLSRRAEHEEEEEQQTVGELLCKLRNQPAVPEKVSEPQDKEMRDIQSRAAAAAAKSSASRKPLSTQQLATTFASAPPDFQQTPFPQEHFGALPQWPAGAAPMGYVVVPFPSHPLLAPAMMPQGSFPHPYSLPSFSLPPLTHLLQQAPSQQQQLEQYYQLQQQLFVPQFLPQQQAAPAQKPQPKVDLLTILYQPPSSSLSSSSSASQSSSSRRGAPAERHPGNQ